ncbi:MAG: AlpA family phage regulatory protein [Burkholderiaceae bacterium]|nr:AlpA family phage regulatory protein [Burkholderiaceae bacterium]
MNGEQKTASGTAPAVAGLPDRLLRLPAVLLLTGRGRTVTLDDVKAGRFPAPIRVGRATLWSEREIQGWIADRIRTARGGR